MKLKVLLILMLAAVTFTSYAQDGGIRGKVVSRNGRVALSNVQVKIESLGLTAMTDKDGNFIFENLPAGSYTVLFSTPDFEDLNLMVRVGDKHVQDLKSVIIVPSGQSAVLDDAVFAEFDSDSSSSDTQALPSSLSSSKDLFNNIASYRFSEMRFNVRGYDSQYSDIYLNGIRFNDAMTGYGPWSLWSGLNDATRNQENYTGLEASDFGIGGIGGMTNVNARASQMRKGFRVSVSNGNQMYRFRAMVSYGSGQLDNGWSYAFSVGTRQGGNGYVDGVYYNSYSYFASAEKLFGQNHRLALPLLASPSERGAQQASTDEAYALFGNNYYNPNVGYQAGKLRNSRVRNTHGPVVMLGYTWDVSEDARLSAATTLRVGRSGYSGRRGAAGAGRVLLNQRKSWDELSYELGLVEPDAILTDGDDYGFNDQLKAAYGDILRPMDGFRSYEPAQLTRCIDHEALMVLMFTSGTTGRSKGVMLSEKIYFTACQMYIDGL